MADLERTIEVVFQGENRLSAKVREIDNSLGKLGTSLGGVAGAAGRAGAAVATFSAAVTGLVGAGLAKAVEQSGNFERALLDLQKIVGDHPEKLDAAKAAVLDLAQKYGESTTAIMDMVTEWKKSGYDVEGAIEGVSHQLDLMVSDSLSAQEASEALAKVMRGFKLEAEDTQSVVDALASTSDNYAFKAGQMAQALGRVAPIAEQMGFTMEETAGILTPVIEVFRSGSEAGRSMRTAFLKLKDDTSSVQKAMKTLGVSQRDVNGQFKSGKQIFTEVAKAWDDLAESQKAVVASQLVGIEQSGKFVTAMNNIEKSSEATKIALNDQGTAAENANTVLQGLNRTASTIASTLETLGIAIGDKLRDNTTDVLDEIQKIFQTLQEQVEAGTFDELFESINEDIGDFADWLEELRKKLPEALESVDWSGLADSVGNVGESFKAWFDGLDLTTAEGLADAIQKVSDTLDVTIDTFTSFNKLAEGTVDAFRVLYNAVQTFMSVLGTGVVTPLWGIVEALAAIPGTGEQVEKMAESLKDDMVELAERTGKNAKQTKQAWEDLVGATDKLPEKKATQVDVDDKGSAQETKEEIDKIPKERKMEIQAGVKKKKLEKDIAEIQAKTKQEKIEMEAEVQKKKFEKDITEIKNTAKTTQKAMKMTAKVETAQAKSSMEKFKSAMEGISSSVSSTSSSISSMFSDIAGMDDSFQQSMMEFKLNDMIDMMQKQTDAQVRMINERIKTMKAQRDQMESGEGLITIQGEGLEPELEAFMWKVIEKVQVRVNEQSASFLLGLEGG